MRAFNRTKPVRLATEMTDVQSAINSALTIVKSASEWRDVETAARSIGAAAALLGALAEKVAEL